MALLKEFRSMIGKSWAGSAAWAALLAALGCSAGVDAPPLGKVSGIVTLDDAPLEGAQIVFQPAEGSQSVGMTDGEGRYTLVYRANLRGAVLGQHKVRITKFGEAGSPDDTKNQLPEKYNQSSSLNAEVDAGENSIDFELKSES